MFFYEKEETPHKYVKKVWIGICDRVKGFGLD